MSADFHSRVEPLIRAAGVLALARPWVERAGLELRPHSGALFAERREGRCAVCDGPLPARRTRVGIALSQALGSPRRICSWAAKSPCKRVVDRALQEDQRARGLVVYRALIATLAVALHPELALLNPPRPGRTTRRALAGGWVRLNRAQVAEIRQRLARGERHRDIAQSFGVSRSTITSINRGLNWKSTPAMPERT